MARVAPGNAPASPMPKRKRTLTKEIQPVAQPAAGNLEQRIGPAKSAEDPPHGDHVKTELLADLRCRRRDVDAIQIGDEVHEADHPQDVPPAIAGLCLFGFRHGGFPPRLFLPPFCGFVFALQAELVNGETCCSAVREFITWP